MSAIRRVPVYNSGFFDLYKEGTEAIGDFKKSVLINQNMKIWYKELSVYDTLKEKLEESGKEVTMKIVIPRYDAIDSHCFCRINGRTHRVFNATSCMNKDGFPETMITLIRPENELTEASK